jgi:predicted RNase H-like HicB family nuclease/predicted RNA binding protein YcfA (HicA-like mRNA interferase family)
MRYRIAVHQSDEGFSVSVPGLPGCWSQGATEAEAIENIKDAIREYLAVVEDQLRGEQVREVEVVIYPCPRSQASTISTPCALEKAGFAVVRQGKHIVMSNGTRILTVPRHNPVNAFTLGGIVRDAGLTVEPFRALL